MVLDIAVCFVKCVYSLHVQRIHTVACGCRQVAECVDQCGVGFMYAPVNHPSMRVIAPIRKALGVRSIFNLLGPMTNAAGCVHMRVYAWVYS